MEKTKKRSRKLEDDLRGNDTYTQYLTFMLGNETYGIAVKDVREVVEFDRVFKIPRVPDSIRGVINLRGEVVPVVDLYSRFYSSKCEISILTSVVIVEVRYNGRDVLVGIMIDEVKAVVNIYNSNIESTPEFGAKIRGDFVKEIGKVDSEFVILLDTNKVIDIHELSNLCSSMEVNNE